MVSPAARSRPCPAPPPTTDGRSRQTAFRCPGSTSGRRDRPVYRECLFLSQAATAFPPEYQVSGKYSVAAPATIRRAPASSAGFCLSKRLRVMVPDVQFIALHAVNDKPEHGQGSVRKPEMKALVRSSKSAPGAKSVPAIPGASFVIRHVVLLQKNSPGNYRYGDVRIKRALFP